MTKRLSGKRTVHRGHGRCVNAKISFYTTTFMVNLFGLVCYTIARRNTTYCAEMILTGAIAGEHLQKAKFLKWKSQE